jgi:hypothetical protein
MFHFLTGSRKDPSEVDSIVLSSKQKYQAVFQKILSLEKYSKEEMKDLQNLAKVTFGPIYSTRLFQIRISSKKNI